MPTYTRSTKLATDQDTAYAYLSDVTNLPRYLPQMTKAEPVGDGSEVETAAVVSRPGEPQRTEEGTAWFKADDDAHKVSWGSEGENDYHGELDFDDAGGGACTLRLSLHTEHQFDGMEGAIDDTLATIKQRLEQDANG